jgi:hypothetical protein
MPRTPQPRPTSIECPFTLVIDSNEAQSGHHGYTFQGIRGPRWTRKYPPDFPIIVPTVTQSLLHLSCDYSILGMPSIGVERKSKSDFFGSMADHCGFEARVRHMASVLVFGAVVVEAQWEEIYTNPPTHSQMNPKSIFGSVLDWQQCYPNVHWQFMPGRWAAEQACFRILERYWINRQNEGTFCTN